MNRYKGKVVTNEAFTYYLDTDMENGDCKKMLFEQPGGYRNLLDDGVYTSNIRRYS